jgi:hypothetical protein
MVDDITAPKKTGQRENCCDQNGCGDQYKDSDKSFFAASGSGVHEPADLCMHPA